jgi:hypothetical protein
MLGLGAFMPGYNPHPSSVGELHNINCLETTYY